MKNQIHTKILTAVGLIWSLGGCASVGVRNPVQATGSPKLPKQILISDFDTSRALFRVNRAGDELATFREKTANVLANYLVSDFNKSVMPATRRAGSTGARSDAWLITGEFVRVNGGNRELRGLIGLGLGGTKMETVVRVYDLSHLSKEPLFQFETSGGSNAEAGALLGGKVGGLPNALINGGMRGVTDDTARTAREITSMVADYYVKNGGQLRRHVMKPKILQRHQFLGVL
jgi:hypothetical protein